MSCDYRNSVGFSGSRRRRAGWLYQPGVVCVGITETSLGDTVVYNTLVRVTSPYDRLATAVVKLFVHYNVRSAVYLRYQIVCF